MNVYLKKTVLSISGTVILFVMSGVIFRHVFSLPEERISTPKSSVESSDEVFENTDEKYYLTVSDGKICAYRVRSGGKELISSGEIDLTIMTSEDIKCLHDGIYAESFEELCLYFESYAS